MRKRKAFLVISLVLLLLGMGAWGCNGPPTCTPCPPTPSCEDASATISALETQLAGCETRCPCTPTGKSEAICDGIDDDCDGDFDEDYQAYTCGIGACERQSECIGGEESCTPGEPRAEVCDNGQDDDCDGLEDSEDPDCPIICVGAIPPGDAIAYVGEMKTIQGAVVDTYYCQSCNRQPTFLNFCRAYPDHCFTALIWGDERQQFIDCLGGPPEVVLLNREVCVEGLIEIYEGIPEIILTRCGQLTVIQ